MADAAFEEVIGNRNTPAGLKAFRKQHQDYPDAFLEKRFEDGGLLNAERQVIVAILAKRRKKAARIAWTSAAVSIIGAAAALISAWFAWHPPQSQVAPASLPQRIVASPTPKEQPSNQR